MIIFFEQWSYPPIELIQQLILRTNCSYSPIDSTHQQWTRNEMNMSSPTLGDRGRRGQRKVAHQTPNRFKQAHYKSKSMLQKRGVTIDFIGQYSRRMVRSAAVLFPTARRQKTPFHQSRVLIFCYILVIERAILRQIMMIT
ncbi:hypothetical protein [Dickeya dianthicola]|uniref:hypothetical protein n=1 Tax=Dickeya dianthicola TaxID=204039 RepID=UPI0018690BE9|nr:hypothetical protein [Dickeya dianthicola]QOL14551.1 hypothetical protein HGI48_10250 [Dickeya dianthicola]